MGTGNSTGRSVFFSVGNDNQLKVWRYPEGNPSPNAIMKDGGGNSSIVRLFEKTTPKHPAITMLYIYFNIHLIYSHIF